MQVVRDFGALWKTAAATWREMDMLVLDEVSMLQAEMLEWLDCEVATYSLICAYSLLCLLMGFICCCWLSHCFTLYLTVSACLTASHCIILTHTLPLPLSPYLSLLLPNLVFTIHQCS